MTDPTGEVFISYNHEQKEIAVQLDRSLREHGIPVWRDERKTGPDPLESQIESVLQSPNISGAILLVSEDVPESSTIVNVEMPQIHSRQVNSDEFYTFVVRCPGLSAKRTDEILSGIETVGDFSEWYFHKLEADREESPNYHRIAEEVIEQRFEAIVSCKDNPDTIRCTVNSYEVQEAANGPWFQTDFTHYFEDGLPSGNTWNNTIYTAVARLASHLGGLAKDDVIEFSGPAHLPVAFALGHQFPTSRGVHTKWVQKGPKLDDICWEFVLDCEDADLTVDSRFKDSSKTDLGVFLSLTRDVRPAVSNTKSDLPDFNTEIDIDRDDYDRRITPKQGVEIAETFKNSVENELDARRNIETVHLFQSSPVGLSFLLGQQTNSLPPIQTYVYDSTDGSRKYEPAILTNDRVP